MPRPKMIITALVLALAAIWLANNVSSIGNLVAPRKP